MTPISRTPGLIIAAPASGSGKTTVTLGLLRALARRGVAVAGAKAGPDYIDPAFHAAASRRPCLTLDTWAMPGPLVRALAGSRPDLGLVIAEGVMGLFDGALGVGDPLADGSSAALAALTGWPVVLVVPAKGMSASAGALVAGFARHRPDVSLAGVIFNRVGSARHLEALTQAVVAAVPEGRVLGGLPHAPALTVPERHLGLVQAGEHPALDAYLEQAADLVERHLDLEGLAALARPLRDGESDAARLMWPPLGQTVAVARDDAFAFCYPALLEGWRAAGAEVVFFSPLADEAPPDSADAVYLPGGYPELHAGRLAAAATFLSGLRRAAARGARVYGECGGYMVLGRTLTDAEGKAHAMAGLLPVETSFKVRKRCLGYRVGRWLTDAGPGRPGQIFRGHEFHYASVTAEASVGRLVRLSDAAGTDLGAAGHFAGRVAGSFLHVVAGPFEVLRA
ncbi:cobyrinate a,c-diamide synthase [Pararhodospirillum photometricum]|uniref:Cobyrinate a,c-diamide synthase n=1 Tax=Pararhodospirillum photometricum DSM 122 TaxID=1150469 RepID=H6SQR9_PARPM|nr:cobyrinate a,c-diamide synthase [Pararhodospirillum photometricum]CCG07384.1 Cobyrinate a,c-diamide synthase / hydrogenobyrinic acid a,c-diamide synthase (Glutamine-hydrolysing) [Pararhodospirillum photometricum DSM 122]